MILEILYTLLIVALGYIVVSYCIHLVRLKEYPPGPWPLPIIGNLHLLGSEPHKALNKLGKKHGPVMSFSFGSQRVVVIQGIKEAKETLMAKGKSFAGRPQDNFAGRLISQGNKDIVFSDYNRTVIAMRKIAHGALNAYRGGLVKLEQYVLAEVEALFKRFDMKNGEAFDPRNDLDLSVGNVICAIIFGKRYSAEDPDYQYILNSVKLIFSVDLTSPVNHFGFLRVFPNTTLTNLKRGIEMRDKFLAKAIMEHKVSFDPNKLRDFTDFILSKLRKQELDGKTDEDLVDDVNLQQILSDLFLAGMETTTTALTWCIAYLATYPLVQKRIAEERKKINSDRMPRLSDRGRLHYFEAFIQEALRMGSVGVLAAHKALHNTECNGYRIPAGTEVWYNVWSLHYDENEWQEPYSFKPERFLDKEGKLMRTTGQSFLAFGAGRRACIGEALARMELFVFLSDILYRYDIVPDGDLPDLDGEFGVVLKPKPFKIRLNPR